MSTEYVILKIDAITVRAGWRDVDVVNDQLCIPCISLFGKFFQMGNR